MNPFDLYQAQTRRQMIGLGARGLGALGAASLLNPSILQAATSQTNNEFSGTLPGPHFKPTALDLLREPIETGEIAVVRGRYRAVFPSRFQLIATMNPCPAGRSCKEHTCRCTTSQVQRYQSRISGPLLGRIDLHVPVPELNQELMFAAGGKEPENNRHTPLAELRE